MFKDGGEQVVTHRVLGHFGLSLDLVRLAGRPKQVSRCAVERTRPAGLLPEHTGAAVTLRGDVKERVREALPGARHLAGAVLVVDEQERERSLDVSA
jgi:hypothetical protein